jgi:hypothetical protein
MIKWIPLIAVIPALLWTILFMSCGGPPEKEIMFDHDTKECWVVKRGSSGNINESLFHSTDMQECKDYIKGE